MIETVKKRIMILVVFLSAAVLTFALAGCNSSSDTNVVLPEPDSVESVQLQFCDDSCTVSKVVDITDDNKSVITELIEASCGRWSESINDNPQEVPYVVFDIRTENHENDMALYIYEKGNNYYIEQPYIGRWTTSEALYDMVYDYANHEGHSE